jgi:hypothetical protein
VTESERTSQVTENLKGGRWNWYLPRRLEWLSRLNAGPGRGRPERGRERAPDAPPAWEYK